MYENKRLSIVELIFSVLLIICGVFTLTRPAAAIGGPPLSTAYSPSLRASWISSYTRSWSGTQALALPLSWFVGFYLILLGVDGISVPLSALFSH